MAGVVVGGIADEVAVGASETAANNVAACSTGNTGCGLKEAAALVVDAADADGGTGMATRAVGNVAGVADDAADGGKVEEAATAVVCSGGTSVV